MIKLTRITPVGSFLGGNTNGYEKIRRGDGLVCLSSSYGYGYSQPVLPPPPVSPTNQIYLQRRTGIRCYFKQNLCDGLVCLSSSYGYGYNQPVLPLAPVSPTNQIYLQRRTRIRCYFKRSTLDRSTTQPKFDPTGVRFTTSRS